MFTFILLIIVVFITVKFTNNYNKKSLESLASQLRIRHLNEIEWLNNAHDAEVTDLNAYIKTLEQDQDVTVVHLQSKIEELENTLYKIDY